MTHPVDVLIAVYHLFDDPGKFTTGELARTSSGQPISPTDPRASQFCLMGALQHIIGTSKDTSRAACWLQDKADQKFGGAALTQINDHGGYEEVRRLLQLTLADKGVS